MGTVKDTEQSEGGDQAAKERYYIFGRTHKEPTKAAEEWLADRAELTRVRGLIENYFAGVDKDGGLTFLDTVNARRALRAYIDEVK